MVTGKLYACVESSTTRWSDCALSGVTVDDMWVDDMCPLCGECVGAIARAPTVPALTCVAARIFPSRLPCNLMLDNAILSSMSSRGFVTLVRGSESRLFAFDGSALLAPQQAELEAIRASGWSIVAVDFGASPPASPMYREAIRGDGRVRHQPLSSHLIGGEL
jgi:hypothetical protein